MNNKFSYDEQEQNLTARNKAFLDYLTRRGITPDYKIPSEIEQKRKQEIAKKAYHNTQVLLENYRDMVWTLESAPDQIASELEMPFATLDELLARIDIETAMDNKKVDIIYGSYEVYVIFRVHVIFSLFIRRSDIDGRNECC